MLTSSTPLLRESTLKARRPPFLSASAKARNAFEVCGRPSFLQTPIGERRILLENRRKHMMMEELG
jgi:hypothetical protein